MQMASAGLRCGSFWVALVVLMAASSATRAAASAGSAANPVLRRTLFLEPVQHLADLAKISDAEGSLARTFLSPAHKRAAQQVKQWMADCGMEAWVDVVGNVHGRINSKAPGATAVLLGSHYDTVLDGGAYDGSLGIIVGLSAIKSLLVSRLQQLGSAGQISLAGGAGGDVSIPASVASALLDGQSVHLVAFTDEEGVRFQSTFLGSRAVAGTLVKHGMLGSRDRSGTSLADVLAAEAGAGGSEAEVSAAVAALALAPGSVSQYVEVHIEQGPVLERHGLPLGVVAGIAGQTRIWVDVHGTQGHAGTVPMKGRRDSLAAAAEMVSAIEALCTQGGHGVGVVPDSDNLVCTVGELKVWPGASNVIAGSTGLSVDVRAKTDAVREDVVAAMVAMLEGVCVRRGVECRVDRKHDAAAVLSDASVLEGMTRAVRSAGPLLASALTADEAASTRVVEGLREAPVLVSGAGHDAMAIAETVPKMGMMFVRCRGGISHSPLEHVEPADVAASSAALATYLQSLLVVEGAGGAAAAGATVSGGNAHSEL